jgi:hypothetical protein
VGVTAFIYDEARSDFKQNRVVCKDSEIYAGRDDFDRD